jgi:hypothetical protein
MTVNVIVCNNFPSLAINGAERQNSQFSSAMSPSHGEATVYFNKIAAISFVKFTGITYFYQITTPF